MGDFEVKKVYPVSHHIVHRSDGLFDGPVRNLHYKWVSFSSAGLLTSGSGCISSGMAIATCFSSLCSNGKDSILLFSEEFSEAELTYWGNSFSISCLWLPFGELSIVKHPWLRNWGARLKLVVVLTSSAEWYMLIWMSPFKVDVWRSIFWLFVSPALVTPLSSKDK